MSTRLFQGLNKSKAINFYGAMWEAGAKGYNEANVRGLAHNECLEHGFEVCAASEVKREEYNNAPQSYGYRRQDNQIFNP